MDICSSFLFKGSVRVDVAVGLDIIQVFVLRWRGAGLAMVSMANYFFVSCVDFLVSLVSASWPLVSIGFLCSLGCFDGTDSEMAKHESTQQKYSDTVLTPSCHSKL